MYNIFTMAKYPLAMIITFKLNYKSILGLKTFCCFSVYRKSFTLNFLTKSKKKSIFTLIISYNSNYILQ